MLVVVGADARSHRRTVRVRFVLAGDIYLKNAGKTDLKLNVTVLVEIVVPDVLW